MGRPFRAVALVIRRGGAIAIDSSGNVYVAGASGNFSTDAVDYVTIKYNSAGQQLWVARAGSLNNYDSPAAIAVDTSGNVYVTGVSGNLNTLALDYVTIKYNSAGQQLWVARYNGPGNFDDWATGIAVDSWGNVYVTGQSTGANACQCYDYATIKYNSAGQRQWVARYDGPAHFSDSARAIAIDDSGNVYVTGESAGSGPGGTVDDYATIKYNSAGQQQWVARYNGPGSPAEDLPTAIAVSGSGNVYVTGRSNGSSTRYDYATIKYNSAGQRQWVARYNGPGNFDDYAYALVVDNSDNVYVTGFSFGLNATNTDYATVKYNSAGQQQWVFRYNGPGNDEDDGNAIAVDKGGNVYVTGRSVGLGTDFDYATIKYGNNPIPTPRTDFNNDAHPDFVLYNAGTRQTGVWYMNNNVHFASGNGPTLPSGWSLVSVADFNRDRHPDYLLFNPSTHQTLIWYLSGATHVASASGPTLPSGVAVVATADFNNDMKPDYVLYNTSTHQTTVWYMDNNVHVAGSNGPTLPGGYSLVGVADFNRDGRADYLLFNASTRQSQIWYLSGTTLSSSKYGPTIANGYQLIGVADFNGDGKADHLLYNASTRQTLIWYLSNNLYVKAASAPTLAAGWSVVAP
jgi:hypothetical protein